jgi:hypothetical protein
MPPADPPDHPADEGSEPVDRGQRVAGEARFEPGPDGKEVARFVRPLRGELPADVHGAPGETPAPAAPTDVVETPPAASVWEAREPAPGQDD